jgi:hypothetical protein
MSFMGLFPTERERRSVLEEAQYAIDRHGDRAEDALKAKAA